MPRLCLHSSSLDITHPATGQPVIVRVRLPPVFPLHTPLSAHVFGGHANEIMIYPPWTTVPVKGNCLISPVLKENTWYHRFVAI